MTNEWTPPSKRNPFRIDHAAFGIPKGRYVLPTPGEFLYAEGGNSEGCVRIADYLECKLTLADLQPAEFAFVRGFLAEQAEERLNTAKEFFAKRVPRRYASALPDATAKAWANAITANADETRSLLIVGPTGTGKTHYAYSVLRAVAETGSTAWRALTAADMYAQLRPRTGRDSEAEFEALAKTSVLFVDDLGAAKLTEWTEEVTYRLINHRYEQCLPGVFTSNVPPAQLRDALGERVASRLVEMCERVVLRGDDRRKGMAA
jgi:DNA replication protein DnaC